MRKVRLTITLEVRDNLLKDWPIDDEMVRKEVLRCLKPETYYPLWNHNTVKVR